MKQVLLSILLSLPALVSSQDYKRTQNWYFGDSAGLSFATNPPTPLTDGAMSTVEGCATISDTNGNLLFYTNGVKVWNRNHQVMPNGSGLLGHESSTQAALIVPQPDNDSLFYIFTTYALASGNNGLRYSLVNLNRSNGEGEVIIKNVFLQNPVCEKLTATKHANGQDIWLVAHGFGDDLFYAYLICTNGIIDCPVISQIGSIHSNLNVTNVQGGMKFSSDGKKLAVCNYGSHKIELFDFASSSGKITNHIEFGSILLPYSIEFSKDNSKLYATNRRNFIYQYDIKSNVPSIINSSQVTLHSPPNTVHSYYRYLQIASDNKIYVALVDSTFIGVINMPDSSGIACDFQERAIDLSPKVSKYGLPNFVSSYFYQPSADFEYKLDCETNTSTFTAEDSIGATTYKWNISKSDTDTYSGNPLSYSFSDTGNYTVELLAIKGADTAIQSKQNFIHPTYSLYLGNDTILCSGQTLQLDAGSGQYCYLWNDSNTGSTRMVDTSGTYRVKVVSNGFCVYFDTINVGLMPQGSSLIDINRSKDTLIASGSFHAYQWYRNNIIVQDSSVNYFYLNKQKGIYKVTGTDSFNCFPVISNEFIVDTLTGIATITMKDFIVYPNPVSVELFHIYSESTVIENVKIYTIDGKAVFEDNLPENTKAYNLNHLKRGIYILNVNQIINYKIVLKP